MFCLITLWAVSTPQKGCVRAASECAITPLNTPVPPPGCALHGCIPSIEQVPHWWAHPVGHNRRGCPPWGTSRKPTSHSWQTLAGTPVKQFPLERAESSPQEGSSGSCWSAAEKSRWGACSHPGWHLVHSLTCPSAPRYHLELPAGTLIDVLWSHTVREAWVSPVWSQLG